MDDRCPHCQTRNQFFRDAEDVVCLMCGWRQEQRDMEGEWLDRHLPKKRLVLVLRKRFR